MPLWSSTASRCMPEARSLTHSHAGHFVASVGSPTRVIPGKTGESSSDNARGDRTNGVLTCRNTFVNHEDLKKGFVTTYNKMMADLRRKGEWERTATKGSALERLRARQMMDLSGQEPLTGMVDELAQLAITEITILAAKIYEFAFMDGSRCKVSV